MALPLTLPTFDLRSYYDEEWTEHARVVAQSYENLFSNFEEWVQISTLALKNGRKLLFFGNGGSAADAQHLAAELTVRFKSNRKAIAALALTTDTSALTAIGNDFGFEYLFSRQIEAIGREGDVAIGISTSGKSPNVLRAFEVAHTLGLTTIGLFGVHGCLTPECVDISLKIPSQTTSRIQEMHITLGQIFCGSLEYTLGLA